jgi:hypothetical protein
MLPFLQNQSILYNVNCSCPESSSTVSVRYCHILPIAPQLLYRSIFFSSHRFRFNCPINYSDLLDRPIFSSLFCVEWRTLLFRLPLRIHRRAHHRYHITSLTFPCSYFFASLFSSPLLFSLIIYIQLRRLHIQWLSDRCIPRNTLDSAIPSPDLRTG